MDGEVLDDFVAYPSRWRVALLILLALGLASIGCWMAGVFGPPPESHRYSNTETVVIGWVCTVFFGGAGIAWFRRLFDSRPRLRISATGVWSADLSDQTIPWAEVVNVSAWTYKSTSMIILRLRNPDRFRSRGLGALVAAGNRMLSGGDIAISLTGTDRRFGEAMAAIEDFRDAVGTTLATT